MNKTNSIEMRLMELIPISRNSGNSPLFNFANAIHRTVIDWIGPHPEFPPALQVDVLIGPPNYRVLYAVATAEEVDVKELLDRLERLVAPRTNQLVAYSLLFVWANHEGTPENNNWVSSPFGQPWDKSVFQDRNELKVRLCQLLSRCYADYESPLKQQTLPPWYRRLWHVVSGKPFKPGYLEGTLKEFELHESLPFRPSFDWLDREVFDKATNCTLAELRETLQQEEANTLEYVLAIRLRKEGAIPQAIIHIDNCLARLPHDPQLNYVRAEFSLENSQVEDALRFVEKAIELAPNWALIHHLRGHVYMSLAAWERAESSFSQATELDSTFFDAWFKLAQVRTHPDNADHDRAMEAIDQALECDPYQPDALAMRIQLLSHGEHSDNDWEDIHRRIDADLEMATTFCPPAPFFLTYQAEKELNVGNPVNAIEKCDEALSLDEKNVKALGMRGVAHLALGEVELSLKDLEEAIELGSQAPAVFETRGRIRLGQGDFELAKQDCQQAIEYSRQFLPSFLTLASAQMAADEASSALATLSEAIEMAPKWDTAHRALGDAHVHLQQYDLAYAAYSRAIDCAPEVAENWMARGISQRKRRNIEKAIFDLDRAIELDRDLAFAHRERASANLARYELGSAIQDLTEVLRISPQDVGSLFERAQCYFAKNKILESRQDFNRVIELAPSSAAAYVGRAKTWIETGDETRAAEDFREAVSLDPEHADDFENTRLLAEAAVLKRLEHFDDALRKVEEAMSIMESEYAMDMRATCYWHDEKLVEAVDDYTWLVERTPREEGQEFRRLACLNNRGHVYVEMGEMEKGLEDLNEAVEIGESYGSRDCLAYSLSARALAFAGLDRLAEAHEDFQRSVELRPENAWVYYNQGLVYSHMESSEEAAVCFQLALSLDEPPLTPRKRQRAKAFVRRHSDSA